MQYFLAGFHGQIDAADTSSQKNFMSNYAKFWLPALLWMGLIFFMSTDTGSAAHTSRYLEPLLRWLNPQISQGTIQQAHVLVRKCGHLTEYAVLAMLCWHALMNCRAAKPGDQAMKCAAIAFVISVIYAASDEYHQSFIPTRGPSVSDVLIDACGAMIGLAVLLIIRRRRIRLAQNG